MRLTQTQVTRYGWCHMEHKLRNEIPFSPNDDLDRVLENVLIRVDRTGGGVGQSWRSWRESKRQTCLNAGFVRTCIPEARWHCVGLHWARVSQTFCTPEPESGSSNICCTVIGGSQQHPCKGGRTQKMFVLVGNSQRHLWSATWYCRTLEYRRSS